MLLLPHEKWLIKVGGAGASNRIPNPSRLQLLKDHGPTGLNCIIAATSDGAIAAFLVLVGLAIAVVWHSYSGLVTTGFSLVGLGTLFLVLTCWRLFQSFRSRPE